MSQNFYSRQVRRYGMRSMALFLVQRDYDVVLLDLRIAGLRPMESRPPVVQGLEAIEAELRHVVRDLADHYVLDLGLESPSGTRHMARLYARDANVKYVLLLSPRASLRGPLRRLRQQGWRVMVALEAKVARPSAASGTDLR